MNQKVAQIYPQDALLADARLDVINTKDISTLDQMFRERVRRSSDVTAYSQFEPQQQQWVSLTWAEVAYQVERWQVAFKEQGLQKGDRVAICYPNSVQWVIFDQAALRMGLVVVPLYLDDRADNIGYILGDSQAKLVLFAELKQWQAVQACDDGLSQLESVLIFNGELDNASTIEQSVADWLPEKGQHFERGMAEASDLASVVYTSGTTGRPKGVMLSHKNILSNAYAALRSVALSPDDRLLSFLPLSHTFERTIGYYASMMAGASVAFNRSVAQLADDLLEVQPTSMIAVPRIFERVHNAIYSNLLNGSWLKRTLYKLAINCGWHQFNYLQGESDWHPRLLLYPLTDKLVAKTIRDKLGGKLDVAVIGGAPLSPEVAKTFISLGVTLLQGYGLTESSPVISVNTLEQNRPDSIGLPLRGVEVKIGDNEELCVKGDNVMQGYWRNAESTAAVMDGEWLKTGDRAAIDEHGFIRIIGRIKDILVLANGEKVPPADIEAAVMRDPLFKQVMVLGEGKPFLAAIVVINQELWSSLAEQQGLAAQELDSKANRDFLLQRIAQQMDNFPGYAKIRQVTADIDEWTVEAGLMTPTLKLKRNIILQAYAKQVESMYAGHGIHQA